jgi:hypothetical protein
MAAGTLQEHHEQVTAVTTHREYTESDRMLQGYKRTQLAWAVKESLLEAEKVTSHSLQEMCQPVIKCTVYSGTVIWVKKGFKTWLVQRSACGNTVWSYGMNASTPDDTYDATGTFLSFEEGCIQKCATHAVRTEHAIKLRILCRMLAAELYWSLEMLQALLHMQTDNFKTHIATPLLDSKWEWTTKCRVGMSKEDVIGTVDKYMKETRVHFGPDRDFAGWVLMCDKDSFVALWDSCIKQQKKPGGDCTVAGGCCSCAMHIAGD